MLHASYIYMKNVELLLLSEPKCLTLPHNFAFYQHVRNVYPPHWNIHDNSSARTNVELSLLTESFSHYIASYIHMRNAGLFLLPKPDCHTLSHNLAFYIHMKNAELLLLSRSEISYISIFAVSSILVNWNTVKNACYKYFVWKRICHLNWMCTKESLRSPSRKKLSLVKFVKSISQNWSLLLHLIRIRTVSILNLQTKNKCELIYN